MNPWSALDISRRSARLILGVPGVKDLVGGAEAVAGGFLLVPVGVDQFGATDLFDGIDFIVCQFELGRGEVVFELVGLAGTDDGGGDAGAAGNPGQGHLCGRDAETLRDRPRF